MKTQYCMAQGEAVRLWQTLTNFPSTMKRGEKFMPNEPHPRMNSERELILPVTEDVFVDFVVRLLGKPQTIEALFPGPFDLTLEDITNCFHVVDHRVKQQNSAQLVQFISRIDYDDNSSVTLGSLDALISYREVRPVGSVAVHLSWVYLIQFKGSPIHERQAIDLSIRATPNEVVSDFDPARILLDRRLYRRAAFRLRISHTERTWGTDIENLMSGQIKTWSKTETGLKKFVYTYPGWIGLFFSFAFFVLVVWGASVALTPKWIEFHEKANRGELYT